MISQFDPKRYLEFYLRNSRVHSHDLQSGHVLEFLEAIVVTGSDLAGLERYAAACPVSGMCPEDYGPFQVDLSSSCTVIAQIHFRGLSLDFPFVDISAQTGELPDPWNFEKVVSPVKGFRPKAIRIWTVKTDGIPPTLEPDMRVVSGRIVEICENASPSETRRLSFSQGFNDEIYRTYQEIYDHALKCNPVLSRWAECETAESLADCAVHGACCRVFCDGQLAGFIAARPGRYRYWQGWEMVEELLHPNFQGQGLAPVMQREFLKLLKPSAADFVFGTIHAENQPSIRTALRVGRGIVESSFLVPVLENPTR
ncbi:MAG: GNAT family N-acetyltransferase [Planctomycetaceae bacterium]|nr:GNAT family N-acetyltransferase [Planctomycetaceae bacterium]